VTIDPLKTIFTTDARLDDVRRARIWTVLAPRVASSAARRRRWPVVACASIAVVAAAALFVFARDDRSVEHVVPRGGALALPLGPATRAVVEGPGRFRVEREGQVTAVALDAGTLYGEFTGGGGRSLRIEAAGSTIEIVGTLFSVSAVGDTACLAVAHGRVRMTSATVAIEVEGGQRACAVRGMPPGAVGAVDAATLTTMSRYQRTWLVDAAGARSEDAAAAAPIPSTAEPASPPAAERAPAMPAVKVEATSAVHAPAAPAAEPHEATAQSEPQAPPAMLTVQATSGSDEATQPVQPAAVDKALYRSADEAIANGDPAAADRALSTLLARTPQSPLADQARYERARLAFQRKDWAAVRDRVADVQPGSPLREPASYLGCRAAREIGLVEARACLADYLTAFPDAPHAVDALTQLVDIEFRMHGCAAIGVPLANLRAASPDAPAIETWQRRCGSP
jgi:hypothetical protein